MRNLKIVPVIIVVVLLFLFNCWVSLAQAPIPSKYDGFPYSKTSSSSSTISIEAFLDPLCPDSRDAWPPLKLLLQDYSPHISLIVHPFPLPYHDNSFLSCRALHIADKLNSSAVYPLLELFFKYQGKFYNAPTRYKSRAAIVDDMVKFAVTAVGNSFLTEIESGFDDPKTDSAARVSFRYGCSRGVTGTPYFFVNGFGLPNSGSALDYNTWKGIIDPLIKKNWRSMEESL